MIIENLQDTSNTGCTKMLKKNRLILWLMLMGILTVIACLIYIEPWERPLRKALSGKELVLQHHLRYAENLRDGISTRGWKKSIDEERRNLAIEVLSDGKIGDEVVFLYNAVARHNVYGFMARIIFVDEQASVWEIIYQGLNNDVNGTSQQVTFLPSQYIFGQEGWGTFTSDVILKPSNNITKACIIDSNSYEPDHLVLPKEMYDPITEGKGQMLLLDKNGKVLDSLRIKMTEFK